MATSTSAATASTTGSPNITVNSNLKVCPRSGPITYFELTTCCQIVGIVLAIASGVLIGSSFVFKKKGLLRSQKGQAAGEGVAYLKSVCAVNFALERAVLMLSQSEAAMVARND